MKPFAFRLQSLDALRKAERDVRRTEFAAALAEQTRLADGRQVLQVRFEAAQQRNREARSAGSLAIETLVRGLNFEVSLRTELETLSLQQAACEVAVTDAREALASAEREVQVLEKLHARQLAEHQLEQGRADVRRLDEVAAGLFQREAR